MITAWKIALSVLAVVGLFLSGIYTGERLEKATTEAALLKKNQDNERELALLRSRDAATVANWDKGITAAVQNFTGVNNENNSQEIADIYGALSGTLGLRYTTAGANSGVGVPAAASSAGAAAGGNGSNTFQLPPKIAANLFQLVDDADAAASELKLCQDTLSALK